MAAPVFWNTGLAWSSRDVGSSAWLRIAPQQASFQPSPCTGLENRRGTKPRSRPSRGQHGPLLSILVCFVCTPLLSCWIVYLLRLSKDEAGMFSHGFLLLPGGQVSLPATVTDFCFFIQRSEFKNSLISYLAWQMVYSGNDLAVRQISVEASTSKWIWMKGACGLIFREGHPAPLLFYWEACHWGVIFETMVHHNTQVVFASLWSPELNGRLLLDACLSLLWT